MRAFLGAHPRFARATYGRPNGLSCPFVEPSGFVHPPFLPDTQKAREGAFCVSGGEGGIRTHGDIAATAVFKTAALNRSATSPAAALSHATQLAPTATLGISSSHGRPWISLHCNRDSST